VPQLHRRLPAGSKLVNLGISGARLGQAVEKELPKAVEARPDLVTVWNVVNDLNANVDLAAYERDLDRLLGELAARTSARVAIGNCPDLARVPAYVRAGIPPDALRQEVGRWNVVIARATARHPGRAYLVDLYARSNEIDVDPDLVAGDDFHPSAKGYSAIAEVFWDFMVANRLVAA
jgi:lysophospholipase L1-like esterase